MFVATTTSSTPTEDRVKVEELLENLTKEQKEMIERLVTYQDQYEVPSEDSIATLTVSFTVYIYQSGLQWICNMLYFLFRIHILDIN